MAYTTTTDDLVRLNAQFAEMIKRAGSGSIDVKIARRAIQDIIEGKTKKNALIGDLLLTLDEQLDLLRRYNSQYWEGRLTEADFEGVVIPERSNKQSLSNLNILHVDFGSIEETFSMWLRVMEGENPKYSSPSSYGEGAVWVNGRGNASRLKLRESGVKDYSAGIHVVRINLLCKQGVHVVGERREVLRPHDVADAMIADGATVAQLEVMSLCGTHIELLHKMDGTELPKPWMAGLTTSSDEVVMTVHVGENPAMRKANVNVTHHLAFRLEDSIPTILE